MEQQIADTQQQQLLLRELLQLRASQTLLNNRIHDRAAELAIKVLEDRHPGLNLHYAGAARGGLDIRGTLHDKLVLVCEVSTHDKYQGNRKTNVDEDLQRVQQSSAKRDKKYLAVVSESLASALRRNQHVASAFPDVQILDVLGTLPPPAASSPLGGGQPER